MDKLDLYGFGTAGVNVVKSAIHISAKELTKAQNCYSDSLGEQGSIRKRDGLQKLNSTALASGGTVKGAINLPFAYTPTITFYAAIDTGKTTLWRTSTNGTTWASNTTAPVKAQFAASNQTTNITCNAAMVSFKNKIYYAGSDYVVYPTASHTAPTIHCWDGTVDQIVAYAPKNIAVGATTNAQAIIGMCLHNNKIYFSTLDGGATPTLNSRVFEFDPTTWAVKTIGPTAAVSATEFSGGVVWTLASHAGYLWAGTSYLNAGSQTGKIYSIRPGIDTSWTADAGVLAANQVAASMISYKGGLYIGCRCDTAGSPVRCYVRSSDGAFAVSDNGGNGSGNSQYAALTVFGGNLFALRYDDSVAATQDRITVRKFTGTTWSTVYTLGDLGASRTQHLLGMGIVAPDSSAIYLVLAETDGTGTTDPNSDGIILRSTNGTTFTEVDTFTNLRCFIGYVVT
jgi:hypothetical protein